MQAAWYAANMEALRRRYPALAARLEAYPEKSRVRLFKAGDGSVAYGIEQSGAVAPVMDHVAPLARINAQLEALSEPLQDFTRPVLIVGLYPGSELLYLFDLSEKVSTPHCPQPIWVCVDSLACLEGFLRAFDAARVLESPRVRWTWHEDFIRDQPGPNGPDAASVAWLRVHPEFPHTFTLVSGASDRTLDRLLPPLARLVSEREAETARLKAENEAYYDAMSDERLAAIVGNQPSVLGEKSPDARRPRLLMPTCAWSTFIRHSARDACAAFEDLGWETRLLDLEAMLTPYFLVKTINEFKPDVFLFIDHLRCEAEDVYPRNMMFVTWIQDEMKHIHCADAGRRTAAYAAERRRDLVVGYADERLARDFGYPADRLLSLKIPADPRIFHPVSLSPADRARYGCRLSFVSNASMASERVVEERIRPAVAPLGISKPTLEAIHDRLWTEYRAGRVLAGRQSLLDVLMVFPEFAEAFKTAGAAGNAAGPGQAQPMSDSQRELLRLFYWRLNDTIFRHVVLEWADEMGVDMRLYGQGWEQHPRFAKYAQGPIEHGPKLNLAYQAADFNLHLNITQGMHQRLWEIMAAGARPLVRSSATARNSPPPGLMRDLASQVLDGAALENIIRERLGPDHHDATALREFVFEMALQTACTPCPGASGCVRERTLARIEAELLGRPEWIVPDWESVRFQSREEFAERLRDRR